jgi:hypothetical protein
MSMGLEKGMVGCLKTLEAVQARVKGLTDKVYPNEDSNT